MKSKTQVLVQYDLYKRYIRLKINIIILSLMLLRWLKTSFKRFSKTSFFISCQRPNHSRCSNVLWHEVVLQAQLFSLSVSCAGNALV